MSIRNWMPDDRPREKLLRHGAQVLSDAELLAIFLRTGVPGKNALQLAQEAIQSAGGLRALLRQSRAGFCRLKGLGPTKYVQIKAALELGARFMQAELAQTAVLDDATKVAQWLGLRVSALEYEVFGCVFLNTQLEIIEARELFKGTLDRSAVYVRDVVKIALDMSASAVLLYHNHPSGVCRASESDKTLTQRLQSALATVDIRVIDHFIVAGPQTFSFRSAGLL